MAYTPFKMKGPSLYGKLKSNRNGYKSMNDGRANSSPFQQSDASKKTIDQLIDEGFTPADARKMQRDGAQTGEAKPKVKTPKKKDGAKLAAKSPSKFLGGLKNMAGKFMKGEGVMGALNPMGAIANKAGLFMKDAEKAKKIKSAAKMKKSAMKMKKDSSMKMKDESSMKMKKSAMKMKKESGMKMKKDSSMKMKKSAMKMKKSAMKEKMNMVKGPDGKMVPDFAVDGKGAGDMKKSAAKMMKKSPAKQGMKKMTAADKKKLQALSDKSKSKTKDLTKMTPAEIKKAGLNKKLGKSPAKMMKKTPAKMGHKSPAKKPLVGKQKNLPDHLKKKILEA